MQIIALFGKVNTMTARLSVLKFNISQEQALNASWASSTLQWTPMSTPAPPFNESDITDWSVAIAFTDLSAVSLVSTGFSSIWFR